MYALLVAGLILSTLLLNVFPFLVAMFNSWRPLKAFYPTYTLVMDVFFGITFFTLVVIQLVGTYDA